MSGSPVYVDGKLMGAVAMAFAFSKDPIAGIRPIEEMVRIAVPPARAKLEAPPSQIAAGPTRLIDIATPLAMGGFTARTVEQFTPQLRALGLEPLQGSLSGRNNAARNQPVRPPEPGSMISVHLISGDLNVAADGTVTHVDGDRVYAVGHRFLDMGNTDLPFSRAEVLTLLPNLNTSFKISASREPLGVISADYSTAVAGRLNRRADTVPLTIRVAGAAGRSYKMELARDRLLTPFLLQMATFSAIDATERTAGVSTITVRGKVQLRNAPPLMIDNIYTAETGVPLPASLAASIPVGYAMQTGYPEFSPRSVDLDVTVNEQSRQYRIDSLWTSPAIARPGEPVQIHVALNGPGGQEVRRSATWRVPIGEPKGTLQITAADAFTTNMLDFGFIINEPPHSREQVLSVLNGMRPNSMLSVRIARTDPGFSVHGYQLPDPPASIALLLRRNAAVATPTAISKLAEFPFSIPDLVISGSKTATL
jgi:hypothetical protein